MIRTTAILALCLVASPANAIDPTTEYGRGFCDAVKTMVRNRDHYRKLVQYPAETVEQSMKRIYEKWPPRPPEGFEIKSVVHDALNLEMAGIDLYVIIPPQMCEERR